MEVAVRAAEELVAAAHRQQRGPTCDRLQQAVGLPHEVRRYELLLAILSAADVQEVVLAGPDFLSHGERVHLELVSAPGRAPREHGDVAAVGIDVEVVGIEMTDDDLHAASSQYGRAKPRSATIFRRASMAV